MHAPKAPAPQINGAIIFSDVGEFRRAMGLSDPDPAFTKLYQRAHLENDNRDADAAWKRVQAHAQIMIERTR